MLLTVGWGLVLAISGWPNGVQAAEPLSLRWEVIEGEVQVRPRGATNFLTAVKQDLLHPGDMIRTGRGSRATVRWSDQTVVRIGPFTEMEITGPARVQQETGFNLWRGLLYFLHRDRPAALEFRTRHVTAAVLGTEFNVYAEETGGTVITVVDGSVRCSNELGTVTVRGSEQAVVASGQGPRVVPVLEMNRVIQWAFYYPAILDVGELQLPTEATQALGPSLAAFRRGDILGALRAYPGGRQPGSAAERVYRAALHLSVGEVAQAETVLDGIGQAPDAAGSMPLAGGLRRIVAAVRQEVLPAGREPQLATEWLAESYQRQGQAELKEALEAARNAVEVSADFGLGWGRVAELEFSFGRVREANRALDEALRLAPRNAQALTLRGFLRAARNDFQEAREAFEAAILQDGALANAWLGRGLCRIRQGEPLAGREDLMVAAALEPQRAVLRSYLGKAYAHTKDSERAVAEWALAERLDPRDPTAWFYSALHAQEKNRLNEAVRDIEHSQELNDNRRVYRSELLLDQDRSVRGANLASMYRDAGMSEVSVREAARAVEDDYGNYSAHLFLANSYDVLQDPKRVNLRYETVAKVEYLVANLLAPASAGVFTPVVSQQEYSRMLEQAPFGAASVADYTSNGDAYLSASQFGTFGDFSYSVDVAYRHDNGQRRNNEFEELQVGAQVRQQVSAADTLMLQAVYYESEGGDVFPRYDPDHVLVGLEVREWQEPMVNLGWHHEWSPGVHTLFLASRLHSRFEVDHRGPTQVVPYVDQPEELVVAAMPVFMIQEYEGELEIYSFELQQSWRYGPHQTLIGGRVQTGGVEVGNVQDLPWYDPQDPFFTDPAIDQEVESDFERYSVYGYHHWSILDPLLLVAGVSYDWLDYPENFRAAPVTDAQEQKDQVSPKVGIVWRPTSRAVVRGAYTRSIAGATLDQSVQLEPTHVAGFLQSFRSLQPEAIGGAISGAAFETWGASLEYRFPTDTYVGVTGERLDSEAPRTLGAYRYVFLGFAEPTSMEEELDYQEATLRVTINQLVRQSFALGVSYRLTDSDLDQRYTNVTPDVQMFDGLLPSQHLEALLHQLSLDGYVYHACGGFAHFQALWTHQQSDGYQTPLPDEDFWHLNVWVGLRFLDRRAEIRVGVLNLTDQDYRLNPLSLYQELYRDRTFTTRLQFRF